MVQTAPPFALRTAVAMKSIPFNAILNGREIAVGWKRRTVDFRLNRSRGLKVDIGESFRKGFRMTEGNSGKTFACRSGKNSAPIYPSRGISILYDQIVRIFLMPLK